MGLEMVRGERVFKWDNAKFVLIFLVVFGHCIDLYYSQSGLVRCLFIGIYAFHMPAFLFLSGLFAKSAVRKGGFPWKKVISYLLLYVLMELLYYFTRYLIGGEHVIELNLLEEMDVPWYSLAMVFFFALLYMMRNTDPRKVLPILLVLGCLAGYIHQLGDYLVLARVVYFYPFFYFGYCLDVQKLYVFLNKPWVRLLAVAVLVGFAVFMVTQYSEWRWFRPLLTGRNSFAVLKEREAYGALYRLGLYAVSFVLTLSLLAVMPNGKIPLISVGGQRTMAVYVFHHLPIFVFKASPWFAMLGTLRPRYFVLILAGASLVLTGVFCIKIFSTILRPCLDWQAAHRWFLRKGK